MTDAAAGLDAAAPEEPEVALAVGPRDGVDASPGDIGRRRSTLLAVDSRLIDDVGATHPRPLIDGGIELPQVVEVGVTAGIVVAAEEPKIAVRIRPGYGSVAATWSIAGGGYAQTSIDATGISRCASGHPCPITSGWVIFPKVVEIAGAGVGAISI